MLQGAAFGYATRFPPAYTQAMMAGQGLAGLIVATAAIATAASSKVIAGRDGRPVRSLLVTCFFLISYHIIWHTTLSLPIGESL